MLINSNITQRRLVAEIKEWSDSHPMIDRFGYGDFLEVYSNSKNSYPYFTVNIKDSTSSQWYFNFTLEVCIIGWLYDNKKGQLDSESELIETLRDFQNTITVSPRWQAFSRMQGDMTMQKVLEKGGDKALAWCGRLTLQVKKTSGFCSLTSLMPEYDFESGNIITPTCAPVSIFEDLVFKESIPSGGSFYYTTGGLDATLNVNGELITNIPSGGSFDLQVLDSDDNQSGFKDGQNWRLYDSEIYINSILFASLLSGYSTNIEIKDSNGNQVGTNGIGEVLIANGNITNSDNSINIPILAEGTEVLPDIIHTDSDLTPVTLPAQTPMVCTPLVGVSTSILGTGQDIIYASGDDGWRFQNGDYASVFIAEITDYYTLSSPNEWGNNKRFTGDTGGYMDEATGLFYTVLNVATTKAIAFPNDIIRDYATRRRIYFNRSGARNWADTMANIQTESKGGETGWYLMSKAEYETLSSNNSLSPTYIDSRLFNWSSFNMWSSTTLKTDPTLAFRYTSGADSWSSSAKSGNGASAYIKIF